MLIIRPPEDHDISLRCQFVSAELESIAANLASALADMSTAIDLPESLLDVFERLDNCKAILQWGVSLRHGGKPWLP